MCDGIKKEPCLDTWVFQVSMSLELLVTLQGEGATLRLWGEVLWTAWNRNGARNPLNVILFSMCAHDFADGSGRHLLPSDDF